MKTVLLTFLLLLSVHLSMVAEPITEPVYLIRGPRIKSANPPPLLILLHGMGSNEKDLFAFADQIPENFMVVSLRAPYEVGKDAYIWFETDLSEGKRIINRIHAEQSRKYILQFISEFIEEYPYDPSMVYLCGFSQGAVMSYSIGLTRPDMVKGIAVMSGRILDEVKPLIVSAEKLTSLDIFITHGTKDEKISISYAREAVAYLKEKKKEVTYKEYNEGHTISKTMLLDLVWWLKGR